MSTSATKAWAAFTTEDAHFTDIGASENPTTVNQATETNRPTDFPKLSYQVALAMGRRQALNDLQTGVPLAILDAAAALAAACIALVTHVHLGGGTHLMFIVGVVLLVVSFQYLHGLYPGCALTYEVEFQRILRTSFCTIAGVGFGMFIVRNRPQYPWICWATLTITLPILLATIRPLARHYLGRFDWWAQPVVVLGNNGSGMTLYQRLANCRHEGIRPAGIVFDPSLHWNADRWSTKNTEQTLDTESVYLGPIAELESILCKTRACRLAVADRTVEAWQDIHNFHSIPHMTVPTDLAHHPTNRGRLLNRGGAIELHYDTALTHPYALLTKRSLDLLLVIGSMPIWLPIMLLIAIAMKVTDPGPIFFKQSRVGRFHTPFKAFKFRSMVVDAEQKLQTHLDAHPQLRSEWENTHKLKSDPRVTRIGSLLRTTSLDELPQLWNVLVGEMSLVGPRPIIDSDQYDREYIQNNPEVFELYQMVRPGITGLWQVSGRNSTSYQVRVECDRIYLHNWSMAMDMFILWRTVKTALLREGAC